MFLLVISAVRTVARGHQLVYEGWKSFEETCSEVGVGGATTAPEEPEDSHTPPLLPPPP